MHISYTVNIWSSLLDTLDTEISERGIRKYVMNMKPLLET